MNAIQELRSRLLNPKSSFAAVEAYKTARTNLMFTRVGEGCQIIAFTSSFPSEGKTLSCANLAKTIAQNGQKVLLIDADLRRLTTSCLFQAQKKTGLSEYLAGIPQAGSADKTAASLLIEEEPNLYILPSGQIPPNPAELLASKQMEDLLREVSWQFDDVLIDTPPVSIVTDALVLAKVVTGYILLVQAGTTPLSELQYTVQHLQQVGANILGFLLNDLDAKSGSYKYHSYEGYSAGKYSKSNASAMVN